MEIVYKVVQEWNGRYFSVNPSINMVAEYMRGRGIPVVCEYKIGETTSPRIPGSMLFAFGSIHSAIAWRNHYTILRCTTDIVVEPPKGIEVPLDIESKDPEMFWKTFTKEIQGDTPLYGITLPPGTIFCGPLTVLEVARGKNI